MKTAKEKPKRKARNFVIILHFLTVSIALFAYYFIVTDDSGTGPLIFICLLVTYLMVQYLLLSMYFESLKWGLRDIHLIRRRFKENYLGVSFITIIIIYFLIHGINIPKPIFYGVELEKISYWVFGDRRPDFFTARSLHREYFPFLLIILYLTNHLTIGNLIDKTTKRITFEPILYYPKTGGFIHIKREYGPSWLDAQGNFINKYELMEKLTEVCKYDWEWPENEFIPDKFD